MKKYLRKEFICLALSPVLILLLSGIGFLILNLVHIPKPLWILKTISVVIALLGIANLKYLPFYLIVIGITPFLFIIDKMIYKVPVVFLVNTIFFYIIGIFISNEAPKYISDFVIYYIFTSAIAYTIAYVIIRFIANKVKNPVKDTEN